MSINIGDHYLGGGEALVETYKPGTLITSGVGHKIASIQSLNYTYEPKPVESFSADTGRLERDKFADLGGTRNLQVTFNSFSARAMGYALGGDPSTLAVSAATGLTEEFPGVTEGSTVQLGVTREMPSGARNVTVASVMADGMELVALSDFVVDEAKGNIYFPEGSGVGSAEVVSVTYDIAASTRTQIISAGTSFQRPIRFLSKPIGGNGPVHDLFIPGAVITLNGDLTFSSTEASYRSLALTLNIVSVPGFEALYFDGKPVSM